MGATVDNMKLISQKNDVSANVVLPSELKKLASSAAKKDKINLSQWIKIAMIQKLEREQVLK